MTANDELQHLATGRQDSLFTSDILNHCEHLDNEIKGKRILLIGAAGSIGSSTLMQIASRRPRSLHIIDQNENGLAELVRQMRSQPAEWQVDDFQALPLDYGSATTRHFLRSQHPYDAVLNFAALKHVRSEKDPFSTLQMFETNILKQARLMQWLNEAGFSGRFFTVSTDKAANPSSMMGATKRVMEHVLFNSSISKSLDGTRTSARFANVAFSNGSLPQAFTFRLQRHEPLAVPKNTQRYFVSLQEAGEICTLAAFAAPQDVIVIPTLNPQEHLVLLQEVAEKVLKHHGFEPAYYDDELEACSAVKKEAALGRWPLLITELNTAGEKPYEEFMTNDEASVEIGMSNLKGVRYLARPQTLIDQAIDDVANLVDAESRDSVLSKDLLKSIISNVEPAFVDTHKESQQNLDQRL